MIETRPPEGASQPLRRIRAPFPAFPGHGRATLEPHLFLDRLMGQMFLDAADAESFAAERLPGLHDHSEWGVGLALVQAGLLTHYQLDNILNGTTYGLIVGNYRVLDKLGSGGMGDVFLAEHRLMKRLVAVKTMPVDEDCPADVLHRFYAEMRALADLQHPNVVTAFDAGELPAPDSSLPAVIYLVMEHLAGGDLDRLVVRRGALPVAEACGYVRQAAQGMQAAHDVHLVHRDLKPSNMLLTLGGKVKLVDFGLARQFSSRITDPHVLLGSVEYMPPEQSHDPSAVGKPADIYGLGATLFWLLTGEPPYPRAANIGRSLRQLQQEPPRRLRVLRPDLPAELDSLVARMLQRDPALRPAQALAVAAALEPFLDEGPVPVAGGMGRPVRRALIVEDDRVTRRMNRALLEAMGCECVEAADGAETTAATEGAQFDLILLDLNLPDGDGYSLCRSLRERSGDPNLKILVVSGSGTQDELAEALACGADDYVVKPYQPRQLEAKVEHAFRLRDTQRRSAALDGQLREVNAQLRQSLGAREDDLRTAHRALLFAMAKMGESRDGETPGHLHRLREYTLALARAAARLNPAWAGLVNDRFVQHLELCVPLHDIGKIGLPDEVLRKPAVLSDAERRLVVQHPLIGDRMLEALAKEHGGSLEFLGAARGIVRSHHERWDGAGYPDGLDGESIPAAARLTAVADVYDALRRARQHKPAMAHADAMEVLLHQSAGQFEPALMLALKACHVEFERIYHEIGE